MSDESSIVKAFVDATLLLFRMDVIYRIRNRYPSTPVLVEIVTIHKSNVNYQTVRIPPKEEVTVNAKIDSLFKIMAVDSAPGDDFTDVYIIERLDRYFLCSTRYIKSDNGDYCLMSQLKDRTLTIRKSETTVCKIKSHQRSLLELKEAKEEQQEIKKELQENKTELQKAKEEQQEIKKELQKNKTELQEAKEELQKTEAKQLKTDEELQEVKEVHKEVSRKTEKKLQKTKEELHKTTEELKKKEEDLQKIKELLQETEAKLRTTDEKLQEVKEVHKDVTQNIEKKLQETKEQLQKTKEELQRTLGFAEGRVAGLKSAELRHSRMQRRLFSRAFAHRKSSIIISRSVVNGNFKAQNALNHCF